MYAESFIEALTESGLISDDALPVASAQRVFKSGARSR
jgi:hypothetical protein